jgi:hypothetical protein
MTSFNESKLSKILARALIKPEDRSQFLPMSTPIYCPSNNGVRASRVTIIVPNPVVHADATHKVARGSSPSDTTTYSDSKFTIGGQSTKEERYSNGILEDSYYTYTNIDNTIDIDLDQSLSLTYKIPHEVALETDVDLQNLIKSDFAVKFKKAISQSIHADIVVNIADVTELTMGDTLAATLGNIIADNAQKGTGQKFSIYKYDNGAPVTYIAASNQPDYDDKVIGETYSNEYAFKNDVGVPALHYLNLPTVLLPYTTYQEYQQQLVDGSIKTYVETKLNVDTTSEDFTDIGEGVVGSNDTYAVAYTEPKIVISPDTTQYADNLCITVFYGVKLINTANLRKLA